MNRPGLALWAALLAALCFDILFWDKTVGISFPLWVLILLCALGALAWREHSPYSKRSFILAAGSLLLAVMVFLRANTFSQFISAVASLGLLFLLVATFTNGHWVFYTFIDYLMAGLRLAAAALTRPLDLFGTIKQETVENTEKRKPASRKVAGAILRGLLLAFPVVLVLGGLLSSADPIFADQLGRIFNLSRLGEYILRLFIILILAYLLSGLYLHAVLPASRDQKPEAGKRLFKPFLGWTESIVVLGAVFLLFALFVGVQFRYFFGGETNIVLNGFTYSEYARRGFGEMVVVAILTLLLYLGLGSVVKEETQIERRIFSVLSILVNIEVLVILLSAFQRMQLYQQAYGFTRLRIYVYIFIFWLAVLLLLTMVFEGLRLRHRFGLLALGFLFGFSLTFGALNIDAVIAQQNILRAYNQDAELDAYYLKELSTDAVPMMVAYYRQPDLPAENREILGAELACRAAILADEDREPQSWQAAHFSRLRARRTLDRFSELWSEYQIVKKDFSLLVETANGLESCYQPDFYID